MFYDASRGRWVGQVDAGRDPDTGKRRRRKVSAATKTECRRKLEDLREELRKHGTVARRDITVAEVVADWIAHPPATVKSPISRRVLRRHADRITETLGAVPVVKLRPSQVEAMLAGMARAGMATSTITQCRSVLKRALRRAERDGLVARNAAELADIPRGKVRKSKSMTRAEIARLLGLKMTPWWRAYLAVAIGCGLRPGELLGLQWDDVDLEAGTIAVRHALHEEPGPDGKVTLTVADLKTPTSRRTLRMPAATAGALRSLRRSQVAQRLKAGKRWQDRGLVFCGRWGQPMWSGGVRAGFRRLCERAGLGSDWHPHEQRHTFVSVLSDAGEPVESIAAAAGHQNPGITRRVYWHAIAPEITSAAVVMDGVFGTPGEGPE